MNGSARVRIEKMVYGGAGLARVEGRSVYIPFTLPEEEILLAPRSETSEEGRIQSVLEPSAQRVAPGCMHFGVCGGCQYQQASYEEQLRIKETILRTMLERNGVPVPEKLQTHSAEPWGYRNRIRLRLDSFEGRWRVGYVMRGSRVFMEARECPIAAPLLWRAAQAFVASSQLVPAQSREVEFFCDASEQTVQLSLSLNAAMEEMERESPKQFRKLCDAIRVSVPELSGAGLFVRPVTASTKTSKRGVPAEQAEEIEIVAWGEPKLLYKVDALGRKYTHAIARGGFFQVNRYLVQELVELALGERQGGLAWDLFAGAGLFTQALVDRFQQVIAVEVAERAFGSLRDFVAHSSHQAVRETCVGFLRKRVASTAMRKPDLIVVDPPRAGLGEELCGLIAKVEAKEIVYVSCDPETLSRDLRKLLNSGYRLAELHLVDLFPQTYHMETVTVLQR
ncbi:23S rRNA (uracil(1939)-C(5))-methyltransferase RlmD [Terriglobus saanensis]|uniref:(Uracil-5)-methyltransferase n=1 Tax=Terriglobus saanensis (strain ATCC BAA-1853 / DSM 23119 / SP1PR4) TaxID=401053 RepID=E8V3U1_TERSS|nr:23S rRNA (uracil(1939)-C(5))-methyltransferase RlmD [Terriglobus saanensis]ADV81355.1 (Uracil-5)-methyltransferase [Terriglobus saanensis SP1PR4]